MVAALATPGANGASSLLPASPTGATLVIGSPRVRPDDDSETPAAGTEAIPLARRRRRTGKVAMMVAIARTLISQRLQLLTGLLAILVAVSTVVFHAAVPKLGWVDAFYFTVTTFTSTGSRDLTELDASASVKVFGAFLMLLGVLTIAVLTAVVVDDLIGARIADGLGVPVGQPADHVVVCGLGTVGLRVAEQLHAAGVDVVGIEYDPEPATYATMRQLGFPVIRGDASEEATLLAAGVLSARCLVAVTDDDVANLEAGLASRALRDDLRVVLRLFDSGLAERVGKRLDLTISRSVSFVAAPVFAAAMMGREVVAVVPVGRRVLLVADVPVGPGSIVSGRPVEDVDEPGEIRVLGRVRDGSTTWQPDHDTVLAADDRLIVAASRAGLARTLRLTGAVA